MGMPHAQVARAIELVGAKLWGWNSGGFRRAASIASP
jgi:hypothetical protein